MLLIIGIMKIYAVSNGKGNRFCFNLVPVSHVILEIK